MSGKTDFLFTEILSRCKPPLLIELTVVRQVGLWHDAQYLSLLNDDCTVEQQIASHDRSAHDGDDIEFAGEIEQHHHALFRCLQQDLLAEKVLTGISRERKFRESNHLHTLALSQDNLFLYLLSIEDDISHTYCWDCTCHLHKAIFHIHNSSLFVLHLIVT